MAASGPAGKKLGAEHREPYAVAVSGGTGMLGSLLTGWLLQQGAPHVVLLGRTAASFDKRHVHSCSSVSLYKCDLAYQADAWLLLDDSLGHLHINAVFHAGGSLADASLANQTAANMRAAFAPKVDGALACHKAVCSNPLAAFVLFSSTAALLGSPGQSSYAAANSALDGLATMWATEGRAGHISVQWGAWAGGGMAVRDPSTARRLERNGLGLLEPEAGMAALAGVLAANSRHGSQLLAVSTIKWKDFSPKFAHACLELGVQVHEEEASSAQDSATHSTTDVSTSRSGPDRVASIVASMEEDAARGLVQKLVMEDVQGILGRELPMGSNFFEEGLDSIEVMELRGSLSESTGLEIDVQAMYDNPTISQLASHMLSQLLELALESPVGAQPEEAISAADKESEAVGTVAATVPEDGEDALEVAQGANVQVSMNQIVSSQTIPIFLLPPLGVPGARAYYNFVRRQLGFVDPNPIFVLDHVTLLDIPGDDGQGPNTDTMAEALIGGLSKEIDSCQSCGPYILGGHSLGGLTSLQTGIRKAAQGIGKVEIMLFDSMHPSQHTPFTNAPLTEQDLLEA